MARSAGLNSANSQFFICFEPAPFLDRQYTVLEKLLAEWNSLIKLKEEIQITTELSKILIKLLV